MSDGYGPFGFDPDLDPRQTEPYPSAYRAVDLRDGRFAVFLLHRDTREWWRLIAVFSTWERAERYAGIENDCSDANFKSGLDYKTILPLEPINQSGKEELSPAPTELPPEPPTGIISPLLADEGSPYAKLWTRDHSQTLPLSERTCERRGCGYLIPAKRAENRNTKYCSAECAEITTKERAAAKKVILPGSESEPLPAADAPLPTGDGDTWTDERVARLRELVAEGLPYSEIGNRLGVTKNAALGKADRLGLSRSVCVESEPVGAEQDEIAKFIAERGVTKLPPDPRLDQKT